MFLVSKQIIDPVPSMDKPLTFPAPALEPAYDFEAVAFFRRVGTRRRRGTWWQDERDELKLAREYVRETTRNITRQFSIYVPGPAEDAVNRVVRDGGLAERWRVWAARVELNTPEPVREVMRPSLQERYETDAKAKADERRVSTTTRLCQLWGDFLAAAAKNHTAPHALKLVKEPDQAAPVLAEMLRERQADTRELIAFVTRIVEAHHSVGLLELVEESDTALRRTLEMMGLELPARDPDAPPIPGVG